MSLMAKLQKNSTIKDAEILSKSTIFNKKDVITTPVPALNIALSGKLDGGLTSGLTTIAGVSKNFKTGFSLILAKSFLDKYSDGVVLFYDSEFGSPRAYFKTFGIDLDKILHVPITDIEQLKFDIMNQLNNIERNENVMIIVDSISSIASKKEVDDALDEKSVADFTRSRQLKSLFRMVTPHLTIKNIPMVIISHVYQTMEFISKTVVSSGKGAEYSSDTILIIGRQQEKEGTELSGYNFIINVDKSRFVREKSKIPISISFEHGIQKYSGLLDIAIEGKFVEKGRVGKSLGFAKIDRKTGEIGEFVKLNKALSDEFWVDIINDSDFKEYIKKRYEISYGSILQNNPTEENLEDVDEDSE